MTWGTLGATRFVLISVVFSYCLMRSHAMKRRSWLSSGIFVEGQAPAGRATGQCLAELGGKIYIFGGTAGSSYRNDIQIFQPQSRTWVDLSNTVQGDIPSPRYAHAFISSNDKLFLFGGRSSTGGSTLPCESILLLGSHA